jgi:hypothetical protein
MCVYAYPLDTGGYVSEQKFLIVKIMAVNTKGRT